MIYACTDCDSQLRQCGVCFKWLHPAEIESRDGTEVYCGTCTVILRNLPGPLPVVSVN